MNDLHVLANGIKKELEQRIPNTVFTSKDFSDAVRIHMSPHGRAQPIGIWLFNKYPHVHVIGVGFYSYSDPEFPENMYRDLENE